MKQIASCSQFLSSSLKKTLDTLAYATCSGQHLLAHCGGGPLDSRSWEDWTDLFQEANSSPFPHLPTSSHIFSHLPTSDEIKDHVPTNREFIASHLDRLLWYLLVIRKPSEAAFAVFWDDIEWHHDVHFLHVLHLRRFRTRRTNEGLLHCWSFHWKNATSKTYIKSGKITLHGMHLNSVSWWFCRLDAWLLKKGCWVKWKLTPTLWAVYFILFLSLDCGQNAANQCASGTNTETPLAVLKKTR